MTRLPLIAAAIASAAVVAACDRPARQAISPVPENYSRTAAPVPQPSNELPRDADAAARLPPPEITPLPVGDAISDAVITGKIKAAILADPGMAGTDVSVNADHGVVILAGNVKSYEQTGIASAHAQRQDGVMRVDNQLTPAPQ